MNAGLPGTGLGGIFFLLSAVFMPIYETIRLLQGKSSLERWKLVFRQLILAGAIVAGMWLMGIGIGMLLEFFYAENVLQFKKLLQIHNGTDIVQLSYFHIAPFFISIATLTAIFLFTHIARIVVLAPSKDLQN